MPRAASLANLPCGYDGKKEIYGSHKFQAYTFFLIVKAIINRRLILRENKVRTHY